MHAPSMLQQLLIVLAGLAALPLVVTLLAKARLLPLALYLFAIRLCFPEWAESHRLLCYGLLAVSILYPIVMWTLKIRRWRQEERYYTSCLLATATPLYTDEEVAWIMAHRNGANSMVADVNNSPEE